MMRQRVHLYQTTRCHIPGQQSLHSLQWQPLPNVGSHSQLLDVSSCLQRSSKQYRSDGRGLSHSRFEKVPALVGDSSYVAFERSAPSCDSSLTHIPSLSAATCFGVKLNWRINQPPSRAFLKTYSHTLQRVGCWVIYALFCTGDTRWFKYDRDYLCVNKWQFVPVIFKPPCI